MKIPREADELEFEDVDEPDQYNVFEDQEGHNCG